MQSKPNTSKRKRVEENNPSASKKINSSLPYIFVMEHSQEEINKNLAEKNLALFFVFYEDPVIREYIYIYQLDQSPYPHMLRVIMDLTHYQDNIKHLPSNKNLFLVDTSQGNHLYYDAKTSSANEILSRLLNKDLITYGEWIQIQQTPEDLLRPKQTFEKNIVRIMSPESIYNNLNNKKIADYFIFYNFKTNSEEYLLIKKNRNHSHPYSLIHLTQQAWNNIKKYPRPDQTVSVSKSTLETNEDKIEVMIVDGAILITPHPHEILENLQNRIYRKKCHVREEERKNAYKEKIQHPISTTETTSRIVPRSSVQLQGNQMLLTNSPTIFNSPKPQENPSQLPEVNSVNQESQTLATLEGMEDFTWDNPFSEDVPVGQGSQELVTLPELDDFIFDPNNPDPAQKVMVASHRRDDEQVQPDLSLEQEIIPQFSEPQFSWDARNPAHFYYHPTMASSTSKSIQQKQKPQGS